MKFYVTTAIDYVNGKPHIGHAFEKIAADVLARFHRLQGDDTFFLTGTDEHSLNIQRQSAAKNISPQDYCNQNVQHFIETWKSLNISHDAFIRTSDKHHVEAVQLLFRHLEHTPYLYEGDYEGLYCPSCEAYFQKSDDNLCPVHHRPLEIVKERNIFFKLSAFQDRLTELITTNKLQIEPERCRNEILGVLKEGLVDVSITRRNQTWGISCPGHPGHTTWIWFDALINYLSAVGYGKNYQRLRRYWPCDVHIVGKDIIRFHCLLWPALLLATGITPPKKIFGHGFVTVKDKKQSKTEGTGIEPHEVLQRYPADVLRYHLLREIAFGTDGDFSWERLDLRYQHDLANELGNLVYRVLSLIQKHRNGIIPCVPNQVNVEDGLLVQRYITHLDKLDFSKALEDIWQRITFLNQFIDKKAPWKLVKTDPNEFDSTLSCLTNGLATLSVVLTPFIPETARKIQGQLGINPTEQPLNQIVLSKPLIPQGTHLGEVTVLFPKHE